MSCKIFVNYRRSQGASWAAGRLFDRLALEFPREDLFMDVDDIWAGEDFVVRLEKEVQRCDTMLVLIGYNWIDAKTEQGSRRVDNPDDYVRFEIETAIKFGKRVIPVLLNDTKMPRADSLPDSLKVLARSHAIRLTHEHFPSDVQWLINKLRHTERQRSVDATVDPGLDENANWARIKNSDHEHNFLDHLSRFPDGETTKLARQNLESIAWNKLRVDATARQLREFCLQFPDGQRAAGAMARAAEIEQREKAALALAEREQAATSAWALASDANTIAHFKKFLNDWPDSPHVAAARNRISELSWLQKRQPTYLAIGWLVASILTCAAVGIKFESLNDAGEAALLFSSLGTATIGLVLSFLQQWRGLTVYCFGSAALTGLAIALVAYDQFRDLTIAFGIGAMFILICYVSLAYAIRPRSAKGPAAAKPLVAQA